MAMVLLQGLPSAAIVASPRPHFLLAPTSQSSPPELRVRPCRGVARGAARSTTVAVALAAGAARAVLLRARSRRGGASRPRRLWALGRAASAPAGAATKASVEEGPPWQGIAGAVAVALLDIFKAPPEEATGAEAPGLQEIGAPLAAALEGRELLDVRSGEKVDAGRLVAASGSGPVGVFFLTHWGDFNSWEVVQQLRTAQRKGRLAGASISVVGIGSTEAGRRFADFLELPEEVRLFADTSASCHAALCFSRGALPQYAASLNPYFRVFLMLLGVGSPGTIRTVLGGYVGNRSLPSEATAWVDEALRQGATRGRWPTAVPRLPGDGKMLDLAEVGRGVWDEAFGPEGLRPFELATVRLQNMVGGILANWGDLAPEDDELLVQQGGAVILGASGEVEYYYRDKGILTYVPVEEALKVLSKGASVA